MIKIAARIFDIYDDSNLEVASRLGKDFVATKVAEREEVESLPDYFFGLIMKTAGGVLRRRYPLHDADAIKLSRAYFEINKETLPSEIVDVVEAKISAAEAGDCTVKVAYVDATAIKPNREKVAYASRAWGLVIDGQNHFPIHDADLVKTAEARFGSTIEGLEPEEAFLYARNIAKRAEQVGVKISEDSRIHLYTNDTVNTSSLKEAVADRRRILKAASVPTDILDQLELAAGCTPDQGQIESDDSFGSRLAKVASLKKQSATLPADKIVATLQQIDKLAGFTRDQYLRGMLDPFAACFRADFFTKKAAMNVDGIDLSTVDPQALASKFDPEFCAQFSQQPANSYRSLPNSMQAIIRQLSGDPNKVEQSPVGGDPQQLLAPVLSNSITMGS